MPLTNDCNLLELFAQANNLLSFEQALKPLAYLSSAFEQTMWECYQPAVEQVIMNEQVQGDFDERGAETIQKMGFKWFNQRISRIE